MLIKGITFLCILPLAICGTCEYYSSTLECNSITQDDFLYEVFKKRDDIIKNSVDNITILNSNFAVIESFPNLPSLFTGWNYVNTLIIRNSSVRHINNDAFEWLNYLRTLDLGQNNLSDITFVKTLPSSISTIVLSENNLNEIDLNYLSKFSSVNLNRNKITSLLPYTPSSYNYLEISFVDLSYNKLTEFNDTNLNCKFSSLNLSYNVLTNIQIKDNLNVVTLIGNNISSINSNASLSASELYLSFIPANQLRISSVLSVANTFLGSLNNENKLQISYGPNAIVDLSRTSLTNISENYFQNMEINELKLNQNNLGVLNKQLFSSSTIRKLDLSYSGINNITKEVFENSNRNSYSFNSINLTGNLLEEVTDICQSLPYTQILDLSSIYSNTNSYYSFYSINLTGNLLEEVPDICQSLPSTQILDLSSNRISKLNLDTFENCSSLKVLNISKSRLSSVRFSKSSIGILDLSENNITHIGTDDFNLLNNLVTLILNKNQISSIDGNSFNNLNVLNTLDLSDNLIEHIGENAFVNLKALVTLNLWNNKLKILESNTFNNLNVQNIYLHGNDVTYIKSRAFNSLYNLRILNLSGIGLMSLENEVFYKLDSINLIDLSNNNLVILDNATFRNLPLQHLNLSGNKIEEIKAGSFENLNNLQNLNLSNLKINKLEPFAFSILKQLQSIDLRNNNITGIETNVFKNIKVTNMYLNGISKPIHLDNTVVITNLSLEFNGVLEERTISNVYLKYLYLINSQIDLMKNNCLLGNYNLEQLNIINSNVAALEPGSLGGLFSLKYLDASLFFKNTKTLEANIFKDLIKLQVLKLSDTVITEIHNEAFFGLSALKELYLDGNNLNSIHSSTFTPLNSSLEILDLSRNSFTSLNLEALGSSLSKLRTLNVSSGSITQLLTSNEAPLPNSIENLYLSKNDISSIDSITFRSFVQLKTLYLNNNRLGTIKFMTFNYTNKLEELRLDRNSLSSLSPGIFDGIENLKILNISHNANLFSSLYRRSSTFLLSLNQLNSLYLDNTSLKDDFIYNNLRNHFSSLRRLTINENRFSCSFLSDVLLYFQKNIDYIPYNPRFDVKNINGITCT